MNTKPNILFTATFSTPFIREDVRILRSRYTVTEIISSGIGTFVKFLMAIGKSDITFSWFASVYSSMLVFLAKLLGKKSIIILGGVDVAKEKEYNYGIWNSWWKAKIVRYGIKSANVVLAVDPSLRKDAIALAKYSGKNISIVPTGYDSTFWVPGTEKQNFVLTVANCSDIPRFRIKGIDFLYDVARAMPDVSFILVGITTEMITIIPPPSNATTHNYMPQESLLAMYQQAKVYFQPSRREGLPNTLCEAMLCECYPVGTNVGGIPTAIGHTGSVIPFGDINQAMRQIALGLQHQHSPTSRERIGSLFPRSQRERQLIEIVNRLAHA